MDSRWLGGGIMAAGALGMPGPSRIVAFGWLGERPGLPVLLLLAAIAFCVIVGFTLVAWKLLARDWPPREVTAVLVLFVAARIILDLVRMMGFWLV